MSTTLAVLVLPNMSGLAADNVDWDFVFDGAPSSAIVTLITNFMQEVQASGAAVSSHVSSVINRVTPSTLHQYDVSAHLSGSPHGSPVRSDPVNLLSPSSDQCLPSEVAAVISYHSDLTGVVERVGATRPGARHRGRLYIGPLDISCQDAGPYIDRPTSDFRNTLAQAAGELIGDSAVAGQTWMQWSRKDAATRLIIGGYVDDAWDTQRRRGEAATNRSVVFP